MVTAAVGRSPHFSSAIATTAHFRSAGWQQLVCSTSIVEMFSPPSPAPATARGTGR
jgi:hypothetical protein